MEQLIVIVILSFAQNRMKTRRLIHRKRKSMRRTRGGQVTFRNNTKPDINLNNSTPYTKNTIPANYWNTMTEKVHQALPTVSQYHAENAGMLGVLDSMLNDSQEMKDALRALYNPQPLTDSEKSLVARLMRKNGIARGINRIAEAPIPEITKQRILNRLRYERAVQKVAHIYEKDHVTNPKFLHPEWNAPRDKEV